MGEENQLQEDYRNGLVETSGMSYIVGAEKYFKVVRMIDGLTGVKKEVQGDSIIYSPAGPNPDLKVRAITKGNISVDNNERKIILSEDIELANGLENKLKELISYD